MHYRSAGSTVFTIKHPKFWKSSNDKKPKSKFSGMKCHFDNFSSLKNNLFEFYSKRYANEIKLFYA